MSKKIKSNPLKVYDLSSPEDFEFFLGEKKVIKYKIVNEGFYPVRKVAVNVSLTKPDGDIAKRNYIDKVSDIPDHLEPKQEHEFTVTITIPDNYDEIYFNKSVNQEITAPLKIGVHASGTEYIRDNW